jgi:hypothetical protein
VVLLLLLLLVLLLLVLVLVLVLALLALLVLVLLVLVLVLVLRLVVLCLLFCLVVVEELLVLVLVLVLVQVQVQMMVLLVLLVVLLSAEVVRTAAEELQRRGDDFTAASREYYIGSIQDIQAHPATTINLYASMLKPLFRLAVRRRIDPTAALARFLLCYEILAVGRAVASPAPSSSVSGGTTTSTPPFTAKRC